MTTTVILAVLGSSALFTFVQFLIQRRDDRKGKGAEISTAIQDIKSRLDKQERDSCRTQMLLLMSDYPEEKAELLLLAQHYFADLKGDWYMSGLFNRWLESNKIGKPEWFHEHE